MTHTPTTATILFRHMPLAKQQTNKQAVTSSLTALYAALYLAKLKNFTLYAQLSKSNSYTRPPASLQRLPSKTNLL